MSNTGKWSGDSYVPAGVDIGLGKSNGKGRHYEKKIASLEDIVGWLEQEAHIAHNTFKDLVEYKGAPLKDWHYTELRLLAQDSLGLRCSKHTMIDAIDYVAHLNEYDPLSHYFRSLQWDCVNRLEYILINALGAEDCEYVREVSKRFFVSAVDRAINPGSQHRLMMILTGEEAIGKSRFVQDICPDPDWFTDYLPRDLHSVRAVESLQGKFIIESGELVSLRKSEQEAVKAFLSRPTDCVRLAYRRNPESSQRRCVLIGTTNNELPIPNDAEWTRYWPVACKHYEREWLLDHKENLWAEAAALLKSGYAWWHIDGPLQAVIKSARDSMRDIDIWETVIMGIGGEGIDMKGVTELLEIPIERVNWHVQRRIGDLMKKHGWVRRRAREGKHLTYKYFREDGNAR